MNRRKQRKQRMNGIQTWMASPARVESAGVNFSDEFLILCSLCFLLFNFIAPVRSSRKRREKPGGHRMERGCNWVVGAV